MVPFGGPPRTSRTVRSVRPPLRPSRPDEVWLLEHQADGFRLGSRKRALVVHIGVQKRSSGSLPDSNVTLHPSPSARLLRAYLRTSLRGRTRLPHVLARWIPSLQAVPVQIADWPPVFFDMRLPDSLRWLEGSPWVESPRETGTQRVMRQVVRDGDLVLDIGANVGLHLALLSHLVGHHGSVMAFEPNPALVPNLERTAAAAGNVVVHHIALSDRNGEASLLVPIDHSMATLADRGGRLGPTVARTCRMQRLDDLEPGDFRPDFVKCDVEGAELQVFRGAARILDSEEAPIVLYEAGINTVRGFDLSQWDATRFLEQLQAPQFSFFTISKGGALEPLRVDAGRNVNVLAVPRSRMSRVEAASSLSF
jgi:FkbM family methyltransferase